MAKGDKRIDEIRRTTYAGQLDLEGQEAKEFSVAPLLRQSVGRNRRGRLPAAGKLLTPMCKGCEEASASESSREGLCADCLPLDLPGYSGA